MLPKYKIEFAMPIRNHAGSFHHETDDPVACEEALSQLLDADSEFSM